MSSPSATAVSLPGGPAQGWGQGVCLGWMAAPTAASSSSCSQFLHTLLAC